VAITVSEAQPAELQVAVTRERDSRDGNHLAHYVYIYTAVRRKPAKTFWTTSSRGILFTIIRSRERWVGYDDNSLEHRLASC
jgi:hypothetical protein